MTALYHQKDRKPVRYHVLKQHEDGTVELGAEKASGSAVRCLVSKEPQPGFATLEQEPVKK
jgi:hypothetical protein